MYKKTMKKGKPKAGGMWINKKGTTRTYKISLNAEQLPEPDENGRINLVGFINDYKEQPSHPDVNILVSRNSHGETSGYAKPTKRVTRAVEEDDTDVEGTEETDETDGDDDSEMPF